MSPELRLRRPGAVLFACNFNRVRSPMAEALLKRLAMDRIFVDSCGIRHAPSGFAEDEAAAVDAFTESVMAELSCDLTRHRVKTFDDFDVAAFDLVISFTQESHARAVEIARGRAAEVEYWDVPDPTSMEGSRDTRLSAFREVRDALATRIADRFGC